MTNLHAVGAVFPALVVITASVFLKTVTVLELIRYFCVWTPMLRSKLGNCEIELHKSRHWPSPCHPNYMVGLSELSPG